MSAPPLDPPRLWRELERVAAEEHDDVVLHALNVGSGAQALAGGTGHIRLLTTPARSSVLPALPIAALAEPGDRFRCLPFFATISAATCIGRRRVNPYCRECKDGRAVAARVGDRPLPLASGEPPSTPPEAA